MSPAELYLGPSSDEGDGPAEPQYHVRVEDFDGPLELLLHLIRTNEFDIYDLPIAEITRQYLEMLEIMRELNLSVAGEFLFMAATLIHIKSKMLLPPPHEDGTVEEPFEDPRAELVARLLEYQRYKEAAQLLYQKETVRNAVWLRPEAARAPFLPGAEETERDLVDVGLFELVLAFRSVLERVGERPDFTVERYAVSVDEMVRRLTERVVPGGSLTFEQLFDGITTREMLIVTFLALLEMVRLRTLRVFQQKAFGAIHIVRPAHDGRAG